MGLQRGRRHVEEYLLRLVRVRHDPAEEVRGGTGHLGDGCGDQATRARLRDCHREAAPEADALQSLGQGDERAWHAYVRWVLTGSAGGAKSHVSGTPDLPSAPRLTPFSVNRVLPDEPVRTSTEVVPVNVSVRPSR